MRKAAPAALRKPARGSGSLLLLISPDTATLEQCSKEIYGTEKNSLHNCRLRKLFRPTQPERSASKVKTAKMFSGFYSGLPEFFSGF